jgi:hypothetical protein
MPPTTRCCDHRVLAVRRGDADETRSGIAVGLHHHDGNPGQPFDESCTGLDHTSFGVAGRADLDAWARWLDSIGVELELISMAG